jgi:hypothetical protein
MRLRRLAFLLAPVVAVALASPAAAHKTPVVDDGELDTATEVHGDLHHQHGGTDGHLPARNENVRLIGKMNVNQDTAGRVADVNVLGDYAYLGAFWEGDCQKGGVYVFDISDPANPKQINFIRTANNSYVGEGVQIIRMATPAFTGNLLIHNNEICGPANTGAVGGVSLVDVTDPKNARHLAEGVGDFEPEGFFGPGIAHTVHSAYAWTAGSNVYAVLVDNEELADVDILDITDPRRPTLIAEYDLATRFPQIVQPDLGTRETWHHDVVVKQIGKRQVMLASYWDGGYVKLDVTDPRNATYLADSDFANPDVEALESGITAPPEGNAHQSEFSKNNDYIVAADEDFDPYRARGMNVTDNTEFAVFDGTDTPQIEDGNTFSGQTVFVGRACTGDPPVPPAGTATVAVVERGVCLFNEKLANVEAAGGYTGVIVFNREGADACRNVVGLIVEGNLPTVGVGRDTGFGLFGVRYNDAACRDATPEGAPIAIGTLGDSVDISRSFDGWGYVHLYRNGNAKLRELDTYAIPEAHDPAYASGFGDLSVHEVAMSERVNNLAYFSYYSGGFRVARIVNDRLVETGSFIDTEGNNFWGVQVWQKNGKEYVLASDRDYGLYIFEYTGPGGPNP